MARRYFGTDKLPAAPLQLEPLGGGDQTYDAAADFSLDGNPNGVWGYGYSLTLTGAFTPYTRSSTVTFGNPNFNSWLDDLSSTGDGTPLAVQNTADTTQQGRGANLDPGQPALHPGQHGEVSIVRWTAPDAGTINLGAITSSERRPTFTSCSTARQFLTGRSTASWMPPPIRTRFAYWPVT